MDDDGGHNFAEFLPPFASFGMVCKVLVHYYLIMRNGCLTFKTHLQYAVIPVASQVHDEAG